MPVRNAALLPILVAIAALVACAFHASPGRVAVDSSLIAPLSLAGSVQVVNAQPPDATRAIPLPGISDPTVDLGEFTELAVSQLQDELAQQLRIEGSDRRKSLELAIANVRIVPLFGRMQCMIDFIVTMGNGRRRGLKASRSSFSYLNAMEASIAMMVVETLRDPEVRAYLEER